MKKIKESSFFDKAFFEFSLSIIVKKISIYLYVSIYFLLIICYTSIVPVIAEIDPINLFSMPTSAMFLMFSMATTAAFIAIEIFRTSIDDGTELLTISKPISRKEVVFVKLVIFLIYIITISVISLGLASFSLLTKQGNVNDNLKIIIGMFVATFINGIIFGSIATLLSLYCTKIISLLITLSIAFVLMVFSMLTSFIVESPIDIMQKNGDTIQPLSIINIDKDKNKTTTLSGGLNPTKQNGQNKKPSDIWNEYKGKSQYITFSYFDFGYQLSSLYTLNSPNNDLVSSLQTMGMFNTPIDFKFNDFEINSSNLSLLEFKISNLANNDNSNQLFMPSFVLTEGFGNKISSKKNNAYNTFYKPTNVQLEKMQPTQKLWDDTWNKEITDSSNNKTTTIGEYINHIMDKERLENKKSNEFSSQKELFLEKYFEIKDFNSSNKDKVLKELNDLIYSGFSKLIQKPITLTSIFHYNDISEELQIKQLIPSMQEDIKLGKITIDSKWKEVKEIIKKDSKLDKEFSDNKNLRDEYRVILGLLGLNIDTYIDDINAKLDNKNPTIFPKYISLSDKTTLQYKGYDDIEFRTNYQLVEKNIISGFQQGKVVSSLDSIALIVSWFTISFAIFFITMWLYSRRDFA